MRPVEVAVEEVLSRSPIDVDRSSTTTPPDRILLIPGFMSPRWMLVPLARSLSRRHPQVEAWDSPQVFSVLDATIAALADRLEREAESGNQLGMISHSFGDWIARKAIAAAGNQSVSSLISINPVVTSVPLCRWIHAVTGELIPEISIMAREETASAGLPLPPRTDHLVLWSRWEWLVRRPDNWTVPPEHEETLAGTHNSLVFQPRVRRRIAELLGLSE